MLNSFSSGQRSARTARPVALGLVGLLFALLLTTVVAWQGVEATSTTGLSNQLDDLRADLEDVRANLSKAEAARKAALGDLAVLDQSLDYAQQAYDKAHGAYTKAAERLDELQRELEALAARLEVNQRELAETESELAEQQEVLCERMVVLYKSGGTSEYLAVLVSGEADSLAEVVERFRFISTIADQDAKIIEDIKGLRGQIEEQRRGLEEERARVASLEADQAALTGELQAADRECKTALEEVESAKAAKRTALGTIEKNQAAWSRQEDQLLADSERITALLRQSQTTPTVKPGKGVLSRPVPGPVTSSFGYRIHPIFKVKKLHTGVDFQAASGDPIKAAAAGTVIFAGWRGGYGQCTIIDHGGGLATLYAHQSTISVSVGQVVKRGAVIGKVGSTGYSTGPHLHFEVRVNGSPVDPMGYL